MSFIDRQPRTVTDIDAIPDMNTGTFLSTTKLQHISSRTGRTLNRQPTFAIEVLNSSLHELLGSRQESDSMNRGNENSNYKQRFIEEMVLPSSSREFNIGIKRSENPDEDAWTMGRISCPPESNDTDREREEWADLRAIITKRESRPYYLLANCHQLSNEKLYASPPASKKILSTHQILEIFTEGIQELAPKSDFYQATGHYDFAYIYTQASYISHSDTDVDLDESPHQISIKLNGMNDTWHRGCSQHCSPLFVNKGCVVYGLIDDTENDR